MMWPRRKLIIYTLWLNGTGVGRARSGRANYWSWMSSPCHQCHHKLMIMCCMSEINVRSTKVSAAQGRKKKKEEEIEDRSRNLILSFSKWRTRLQENWEDMFVLFIHFIYFIHLIIWCHFHKLPRVLLRLHCDHGLAKMWWMLERDRAASVDDDRSKLSSRA